MIKCRKCGFPMESTATAKAEGKLADNGPDWKCTNIKCKFTWDYVNKVWDDSKYRTGLWSRDLTPEEKAELANPTPTKEQLDQMFGPSSDTPPTPMPMAAVPPTMQTAPVDPEQEMWDAKDRTSMAQTSINAAATVFQGRDVDAVKLVAYADQLYTYIVRKRTTK